MDRQEVYNKVKAHLLTQNVKSMLSIPIDYIVCAYRSADSYKCAIGCLINDEHYNSMLEGLGPYSAQVEEALLKSGFEYSTGDSHFLSRLQSVHDEYLPSEWESQLKELAVNFSLTP